MMFFAEMGTPLQKGSYARQATEQQAHQPAFAKLRRGIEGFTAN